MMESEFQMSMMGELTFFLGIQVKQMKQDTFVHQAKYTKDLIKKFNKAELKPVSTPMSSAASLGPDEDGEVVDQREYRSMISSLMYLTMSQPNIQFTIGWQFSEFLGISNTLLSLRFGILLLLRWILLAFRC
jgi:isopentenyldiphosphate isomerase